eukprot:2468715-Pyramimonas_sp.AAC.1
MQDAVAGGARQARSLAHAVMFLVLSAFPLGVHAAGFSGQEALYLVLDRGGAEVVLRHLLSAARQRLLLERKRIPSV